MAGFQRGRGDGVRLYIDNSELLPTSELGAMLTSLNRSFRSYQKGIGVTARSDLGVAAIHDGSIDLLLGALAAGMSIWESREVLAGYIEHIANVLEILKGLRSGTVSAPDRKVAEGLARPVANDHAVQINIFNNGTLVVNMNSDDAPEILRGLQEGRGAPAYKAPEVRSPASAAPRMSVSDAQALEGPGLEGTALLVENDWYARLLGGQGVLVPLRASRGLLEVLEHRAQYRFRGRAVRGAQAQIIAAEITEATRLGA